MSLSSYLCINLLNSKLYTYTHTPIPPFYFLSRYSLHMVKCIDLKYTVKSILINPYTHVTQAFIQYIECFHHQAKIPHPSDNYCTDSCSLRVSFDVLKHYINEIIQYILISASFFFNQNVEIPPCCYIYE